MLDIFHLEQFLVFFFEKAHHPTLVSRESHVLAGFELHLHDSFFQEVAGEDMFAFVLESILVGFDEGMVNFCEFVTVGEGEVEVGG